MCMLFQSSTLFSRLKMALEAGYLFLTEVVLFSIKMDVETAIAE